MKPPWLCRKGLHSWRRSTVDPWLRLCRRRACAAVRGRKVDTDAWGRAR